MRYTFLALSAVFTLVSCQNGNTSKTESEGNTTEQTQSEPMKASATEPSLDLLWESDTVLTTNESVLYNQGDNTLYVSCIMGKPLEKDGNGFIAKMTTGGEIEDLMWAKGLSAPKGMGVMDNMLYVTDISDLVAINMETGEEAMRVPVDGATFLNDITIGKGKVYFSDMNTGKLHVFVDGEVSTVSEGLAGINGLRYSNGNLFMLTQAGLQKMDPETQEIRMVNAQVTGGDGLIVLDGNTFVASRWKGEIWLVQGEKATKLLDSKEENIQTADIGFIPNEEVLLVPRFFSNKVSAYQLNR